MWLIYKERFKLIVCFIWELMIFCEDCLMFVGSLKKDGLLLLGSELIIFK